MLYNKKWDKPEAPVKLEPWRQLLLDAVQYIREHGWCQRVELDSKGRVCLFGAVNAVGGFASGDHIKALEALVTKGFTTRWNDTRSRVVEDVLKALVDTAKD